MKLQWTVFYVFLTIEIAIASPRTRKNVLLMITDDGGFEIGAYRNKICQTPNIDLLARDSLILIMPSHRPAVVLLDRKGKICVTKGWNVWFPMNKSFCHLDWNPESSNGMYGLHQGVHHFNSFDKTESVTKILGKHGIKTGIIGKKHVGPAEAYPFDYSQTEENNPINQVGRNITHMKLLAREFLAQANNESKPFFLYIGFHDPHRCGHNTPQYGPFCERWGSGEEGMGHIPDWLPWYYQWDQIQLPYHVQDTEAARRDIAAQYTTMSRLDQGVGLILKEIESSGHKNDTLVIFTSDNGIPFPSGRTNLYDSGMREPMFVSSPLHKERRYKATYAMTSLLDIVPTLLDWYEIKDNQTDTEIEHKNGKPVLSGKSLLPLLVKEPTPDPESAVFASQTHHEVTMYYPMRAVRTNRYKLIHNLNYRMPFPIDQDFYLSPTFQDILNRTRSKEALPWYKTLKQYYNRPQWEFYDLKSDPTESKNLAWKPSMKEVMDNLKNKLFNWQKLTADPWICAPDAVLEDMGTYKDNPQCLPLDNEL